MCAQALEPIHAQKTRNRPTEAPFLTPGHALTRTRRQLPPHALRSHCRRRRTAGKPAVLGGRCHCHLPLPLLGAAATLAEPMPSSPSPYATCEAEGPAPGLGEEGREGRGDGLEGGRGRWCAWRRAGGGNKCGGGGGEGCGEGSATAVAAGRGRRADRVPAETAEAAAGGNAIGGEGGGEGMATEVVAEHGGGSGAGRACPALPYSPSPLVGWPHRALQHLGPRT